ncbi:hypothetical protein TNCV_1083481 [Trichonephila clavipes]|nr:hypothetical protein TNCV_1083481 [Trichonephila clavipes]
MIIELYFLKTTLERDREHTLKMIEWPVQSRLETDREYLGLSLKKSPGRLHTWKNDRKAGGGAYRHQCSCRVRNQQKCRFERLESVQTTGTAVEKGSSISLGGRPRTTTAGNDRYIILQVKKGRRQSATPCHCSATLYSNGATSVAVYCSQTPSQRGPIRPPSGTLPPIES